MPISNSEESSEAEETEAILDYRIGVIEATIRRARNIPDKRKAELLTLLAGLKSELENLSRTHSEEAASITHFADASAHEVSRSRKNPRLATTALDGLRLSIEGLEESHPAVFGIANRYATALSNMGI